MANIPNLPIWVAFFDTFRELPEFWKVKSEIYRDRNKKKIGMEKLLNVYKQIDTEATIKKRITNIRSCYRRELKKIQNEGKSGAGAEDEYIPNLWYFSLIDFLRDQETQISGISTIVDDIHEDEIDQAKDDTGLVPPNSMPQKRKKVVGQHNIIISERNSILKEALEKMANKDTNRDEATVFAESWAILFRKLSPSQQIYAKKAIEDVLILGQLELLNLNSVNTHPSISSNNSSGSSTPLHAHHSRPSTSFVPISSPPFENMTVIQVEPGSYSNFQQLLADKSLFE